MSARGFTLVELLLAAALTLGVSGVVAALAVPARDAVQRGVAHDEMAGGARAALDLLIADVRDAGAGSALLRTARLPDLLPVITPLADLDSGLAVTTGSAVRVVTVPRGAAQGALRDPAGAGAAAIRLATAPCTALSPACGFAAGMPAVLADDASAAMVTMTATAGPILTFAPVLPGPFPAGASVAEIEQILYGVRDEADGSSTLVRISSGGAEQPLLRHVVDFQATCTDVTRVTLVLRVEAASADLRGPAGPLFRRAGNARHGSRWVPDMELRATVALRNVAP
jgi:hypothetical protein